MEQLKQSLLDFLKNNPNANKAAIQDAIGVKGIQLYNLLKSLLKDEAIVETEDDTDKYYSVSNAPETSDEESEEENDETEEVISTARDNSKYKFNGELYGKGPLVRAVVAQYVADNPGTSYKKLKEIFPDELLKRFGIFQDEETAASIAPKGKRYFEKPEQLIKLKDRKVMVCNQFTLANIQPFLKVAKSLGYKIK